MDTSSVLDLEAYGLIKRLRRVKIVIVQEVFNEIRDRGPQTSTCIDCNRSRASETCGIHTKSTLFGLWGEGNYRSHGL